MHRYPHPNNATAGQRLYPPDLLLQRPERVATSSTSLCVEFKNNSTLQDIFNATLKDASGHPRYHITTRSSRTSLSTTATVELAHIDWGNLNMLHMLDTGKVVVLSDWLVASEDRSRWTMTLGNTLYRWTRSNDHFSMRELAMPDFREVAIATLCNERSPRVIEITPGILEAKEEIECIIAAAVLLSGKEF